MSPTTPELCDGRRVFVKAPHDRRAHAMVDAEEHGLAFLRERSGLRVPAVLARGATLTVDDVEQSLLNELDF